MQIGIPDIRQPVAVCPFNETVNVNRVVEYFHIFVCDIISIVIQYFLNRRKFAAAQALVVFQNFRQRLDRIQAFPRPCFQGFSKRIPAGKLHNIAQLLLPLPTGVNIV